MKATWNNAVAGDTIGKTKAKHTPGPWVHGLAFTKGHWIIGQPTQDSEGGFDIAEVARVECPSDICAKEAKSRAESDARLIASAPALLAALRRLVEWDAYCEANADCGQSEAQLREDALNAARAAIAAAEGSLVK